MFAQRICGCPIPVRAQGQAGRGRGQPRLGGWHPCPGQGVGWSLISLPTPVPQFCDFSCFSLAAPRHCGQGGREDKEPEAKSGITLCSGSRVLCSGAVQEARVQCHPQDGNDCSNELGILLDVLTDIASSGLHAKPTCFL